jgi:hypothetical protein
MLVAVVVVVVVVVVGKLLASASSLHGLGLNLVSESQCI